MKTLIFSFVLIFLTGCLSTPKKWEPDGQDLIQLDVSLDLHVELLTDQGLGKDHFQDGKSDLGTQKDIASTDKGQLKDQEVSFPRYDVSPEVKAGARPLNEVEFLSTTGQKPAGSEPDLIPFFPDWCEQKPISPGHDPECLALSQQFGCKNVENPGPVGAWLKPGVAMLFCALCDPAPDPIDCECTSDSVFTISTPLGGSLCMNAIVFESIAPEQVADRENLLDRFKPVQDVGEALAFSFFEPEIRHAFNQEDFLNMGPLETGASPFSCILPEVVGTVAFASGEGFEVQTFRVHEGYGCTTHVIERVTLLVNEDGAVSVEASELVCTDFLDGCDG